MPNSTIMVNDLRLVLRIVRSRCLTWWVRGNERLVDILSKGACHFSRPSCWADWISKKMKTIVILDLCGKLPGRIRSMDIFWRHARMMERFWFGKNNRGVVLRVVGLRLKNTHFILRQVICFVFLNSYALIIHVFLCQSTLFHGRPMN